MSLDSELLSDYEDILDFSPGVRRLHQRLTELESFCILLVIHGALHFKRTYCNSGKFRSVCTISFCNSLNLASAMSEVAGICPFPFWVRLRRQRRRGRDIRPRRRVGIFRNPKQPISLTGADSNRLGKHDPTPRFGDPPPDCETVCTQIATRPPLSTTSCKVGHIPICTRPWQKWWSPVCLARHFYHTDIWWTWFFFKWWSFKDFRDHTHLGPSWPDLTWYRSPLLDGRL